MRHRIKKPRPCAKSLNRLERRGEPGLNIRQRNKSKLYKGNWKTKKWALHVKDV